MLTNEFDPRFEVNHDALTGLLNRRGFSEVLQPMIEEKPGDFALSVVDLDGFKRINDTEGHTRGDAILEQVGTMFGVRHKPRKDSDPDIISTFRSDDPVHAARSGGDEFYILFQGINNTADLENVQERMRATLAEHGIHASVGGVVHEWGMDELELVKAADEVMYENKRQRKQEKYATPEQQEAIRSVARIAILHDINPDDLPMLVPLFSDEINP